MIACRPLLRMLLCAMSLACANAPAAAAAIPAVDEMTARNAGGPLSFDSGLDAIPPCDGAAVALQPIWLEAARAFGLRWQVLAAITKVESGFGCNMGPSSAGAIGWTQFMPATWQDWGTDADGDGTADPRNAVDAVFSTARYLKVTGAPEDYRKAIFAYNHADWYVRKVLDTAQTFGNFTVGEFGKVARLSAAGEKLRRRVNRMYERLDVLKADLADRRDAARSAGRRLARAETLLARRERQLARARRRLNDLTLQYIQTTNAIAGGPDRPVSDDQQLLQYLGDADPQDAVLVYSSARTIMNEQTRRLEQLRDAAETAGRLHTDVSGLVAARTGALNARRDALRDSTRMLREQRGELRAGRRALKRLGRLQARYAREFRAQTGQDGSLTDSPFSAALYGEIHWDGKLRWPVSAPVTSRFGPRWGRAHEGIDLGVPTGTKVRAAAAGIVSFAAMHGGYGNLVIIQHGDGLSTRYAHNSTLLVAKGDRVRQSDIIAMSGNTGHSKGPHVHFEVRRQDQAVDPLTLLPAG